MSRVGSLLVAQGVISQGQWETAARQQAAAGGTIGLQLVQAGVVREQTLADLLCSQLGFEEIEESELTRISAETALLLPAALAVTCRVVPLRVLPDQWLAVAMADPTDDKTVAEVSRHTGCRLVVQVAAESLMSLALKRLYGAALPKELSDRLSLTGQGSPAGPDPGPAPDSEATGTRRFRAPVVLEGKYDRILPDELPPGVDAGYIPLTQVKPKRRGEASSAPVIQVKTVALGPSKESQASPALSSGEAECLPAEQHTVALADRRRATLPAGRVRSKPKAVDLSPIAKAGNREEALRHAMNLLEAHCQRVLFMEVHGDAVQGVAGQGSQVTTAQAQAIRLSLSARSTLAQVCQMKSVHRGPLGSSKTDESFADALGGRRGEVVVVPVRMGVQIAGLLYGDDASSSLPSRTVLMALSQALSAAFARFARASKRSSFSP